MEDLLKELLSQRILIQWDKENRILIHQLEYSKLVQSIEALLKEYHRANPLKPGLLKEELKSRLPQIRETKLFNFLLNQLADQGVLVQEKELVRLKSHKVQLQEDQEAAREAIEQIYLKCGSQTPLFQRFGRKIPQGESPGSIGIDGQGKETGQG